MRQFPTIEAAEIQAFASGLFGIDAEVTWLGGYLGRNAVWRIEPGGRVLKIFFASKDSKRYFDRAREKADAEAFAYEVLGGSDVGVPRYLGRTEVKRYPAILYDFVPGTLWQDYPDPSQLDELALYNELGTLLALMHRATEDVAPRAPEHMQVFYQERIVTRALSLPYPYLKAMRHAADRLEAVTAALAGEDISPKVLTHGDFTPRNLLLSPVANSGIAAIIDFERARIADPMLDFTMLAFKEFLQSDDIKEAVVDGYLSVADLPEAADLYLEGHLLTLFLEIAGWARADDPEYFKRMMQALERLLDGDTAFQISSVVPQRMGVAH